MSLTNEQKQAALGEYLKTASGRQKLAAAITQPLRQRRDYMSVARKAFQASTTRIRTSRPTSWVKKAKASSRCPRAAA